MGRATQGVRLINLEKKNDTIASVCKVMSAELYSRLNESGDATSNDAETTVPQDEIGGNAIESREETTV